MRNANVAAALNECEFGAIRRATCICATRLLGTKHEYRRNRRKRAVFFEFADARAQQRCEFFAEPQHDIGKFCRQQLSFADLASAADLFRDVHQLAKLG